MNEEGLYAETNPARSLCTRLRSSTAGRAEADVQPPTSEAQPSEQAMEEPTEVEDATPGTPAQPQAPLATTLLLTKPTKRLIALFLGLGVFGRPVISLSSPSLGRA